MKKPSTEVAVTEDALPAIPDAVIMDASDRLMQDYTIASDASIGVIFIRLPETEVYRVVDDLFALAASSKTHFELHTSSTGWSKFPVPDENDTHAKPFDALDPTTTDRGTAEVGKAFDHLGIEKTPREGVFVMLDLYFSFAEMKTQTCIRRQAQASLSNYQRLVVLVPHHAEIPEAIAPLVHVIEYGYPTRSELEQTLNDVLESVEDEHRPELDEDELTSIISNGQGMTTHNFETAVALSITEYGLLNETMEGFGVDDIMRMIRDYKTQMLSKTNVLELQPPVAEDMIGGLGAFKEWMHERALTFTDHAKEMNVMPSRGALVVGPPGTGKSLVAKAAGSILNLPVIRFDVGRVFGAYVGQSEQAMRSVLTLIDAMAPCVLMLDEIDKGFSGMGGGNDMNGGTTMRVFGTFLTWMQERDQRHRPVFLIMTANRVEGLPPELLRKGRVDEIWSVNVPNDEERRTIFEIHAKVRRQSIASGDLPEIVRNSEGLVGAEIEALVEDALVMSLGEETPGLTFDLIQRAQKYLKPMSATRKPEFDAMKIWADNNARAASYDVAVLREDRTADTTKRARPLRSPVVRGRKKASPDRK
jgi:ATP-dependent 26S proteasome regulatory subunit